MADRTTIDPVVTALEAQMRVAIDADRVRAVPRERRRLPVVRFALGSAAMIALITHFALATGTPDEPREIAAAASFEPSPVVPLAAPAPAWTTITLEKPAFALDAPAFRDLPASHETRIDRNGGREDLIGIGAFAQAGPYLHLAIVSGEGARAPSLFVDLARRAAGAGLAATRIAGGERLATKLGPADIAEVTLTDARGDTRACLVLRQTVEGAPARLVGWLCDGAAPDRQAALCAIDGLVAGGAEPDLAAAFAAAEPRRAEACRPATAQAELSAKPAGKAGQKPRRDRHARQGG